MTKITTPEMECAVANFLNYRSNLIVPNVHWGMALHECDLLVVTKAGYAWEIEIKISKADLKKDAEKSHEHRDARIKHLYFAIPDYLEDCIDLIPERAGVIVVTTGELQVTHYEGRKHVWPRRCRTVRKAEVNKAARPFSEADRYKVARLGALRIWRLKQKTTDAQQQK